MCLDPVSSWAALAPSYLVAYVHNFRLFSCYICLTWWSRYLIHWHVVTVCQGGTDIWISGYSEGKPAPQGTVSWQLWTPPLPAREHGWWGMPRLSGTSLGTGMGWGWAGTSATGQAPALCSLWLSRAGLRGAGAWHLYSVAGSGAETVKPR